MSNGQQTNNLGNAYLDWNSEESFEQAIRAYKLALKIRRRKVSQKSGQKLKTICVLLTVVAFWVIWKKSKVSHYSWSVSLTSSYP